MPGRITLRILLLGCLFFVSGFTIAQVGGTSPTATPFPTENCNIVIDTIILHPSCPNANDGRIEIQLDGPSPQPTVAYQWFNVSGQPINGPAVENLTAGNYACELTDNNGCADTLIFHLFDPTPIDAIRNNATLCAGQSTIPLLNAVSGGTPPYTFAWQSQQQISCLNCANTNVTLQQSDVFTVQIMDANGCTSTETVFITVLQPLQLAASAMPETCGSDGEINVSATGGASNYSFTINNATPTQANIFSGLSSGSYTVMVEDDMGCTSTESVSVPTAQVFVDFSTIVMNVECFGEQTGTIEALDNSDAVNAFSLNDTNFLDPAGIYDGLGAGLYTMYAEDVNGCITSQQVEILQPDELLINLIPQEVTCPNGDDGVVVVQAAGGVPGIGYEYSMDGIVFQPNNTFNQLSAGVYEFTVKDQNGCEKNMPIVLTEPPEPLIQVDPENVSCPGEADASIVVIVSGGVTDDTYEFSLNGSDFQPGNQFDGLNANSYTAFIRNQNFCVTTKNFIIQEPPTPSVNLQTEPVTCPDGADASIVVIVSGGLTTGYEYSLSGINYQNSNTFNGLTSGVYQVFVKDTSGCVFMQPSLINEPPVPQIQVNKQAPTCPGGIDGSIVVIVSGGLTNDSYQYSLNGNNFQADNNFNDLAAGVYTAYIKNQDDCITTKEFIIEEPDIPVITFNNTATTCPGGNDASIVVIVSGGVTGDTYEYSIDGSIYQDGATFSGLQAGAYTVFVKSQNGCVTTEVTIVNQPNIPNLSLIPTNVTCPGGNNASIVVIVSGGLTSDSYQYSLDGNSYQSSNTFDNLNAGLYQVFAQNQNGCVFADNIIIQEPGAPSINVNITAPQCPFENNASIVVIVSGGVMNDTYEYSLSGDNYQPGNAFGGLGAGSYTAFIRNQNGCVTTQAFNVQNPPVPDLNLIVQDATCPGGTDGNIVVIVSGGLGPGYEYSIDGIIYQPSNTFTGLSTGFYNVFAQDTNGCVTLESTFVAAPVPAQLNVNINPESCPGTGDASIVVIVSGGVISDSYEYSLNGTDFQPSNSFSPLSGGLYTAFARNQNGCITTQNFGINTISAPNINLAITDVTCPGGADASIVVIVSGGVAPPFEYSIDGIGYQPSNSFISLASGVYQVFVRDANDCVFTTTAFVDEPPIANINTQITNASCPGANDASIVVIVSGGVPDDLFEYSLDGLVYQSSNTFTNLTAGVYVIVVKNQNDCITLTFAVVEDPSSTMLTPIVTDVDCAGNPEGEIVISVSGGSGFYEFSLDGITFQPGNNFTGLWAGLYEVFVRDNGICTSSVMVSIDEPSPFDVYFNAQNASCGSNNGLAVCNVSGATGPYNYLWMNGQTSSIATGLGMGYHHVTISDANNCIWSDSLLIFNNDGPDATATVINVSCYGYSDGAIFLQMISGTPPYTFSWSGGSTTEDISGQPAGNYKVTILDANNCLNLLEYVISQPLPIEIESTLWIENDLGQIELETIGGTPGYTYLWSTGDTDQDAFDLEEGTYSVTVTDFHGCTETSTFDIILTGTDDPINASDVSVFPNPTSHTTRIKVYNTESHPVALELFSIDGKKLIHEIEIGVGSVDYELNLENYPAGLYLIRLKINQQTLIRKIIKQ